MAATELATAYISLVPSMGGAKGKIAQELSGVNLSGVGADMGKSMGGGMLGSLKGLIGPGIAVLTSGLFAGFIAEAAQASDATDKFKSTMSFAGLDTSAIDAATKASKAYADQTVYDLPTIQATMAQLAANGVTSYTDITTAAGNLNAVAGGNAETFQSVARSLTQSAGAGKLMTEDWNMLADAIPGASGQLKKSMESAGAYTGDFKKAMEKGEITADEFQAAILELGSQPVAVEAAKSVTTFEGALGNLNAVINSGLMGALDAMKPQLTGIINGAASAVGAGFEYAGTALSGLKSLIVDGDFTGALSQAFGVEEDNPVVGWVLTARTVLGEGIPAIWNIIANGDFTGAMTTAFGLEEDSPAVGWMFDLREDIQAGLEGIQDFVFGFRIPMDSLLGAGVDMSGMVGVGASVREVFDGIWAAVQPLIPTFAELWSTLSPLNLIFQSIQPFLAPLMDVFLQLAGVIGSNLITAVTGLLPSLQLLQGVAVDLFQNVLSTVLPIIVQLVTMLGATFAELLPILIPIITQVVTLAATLVSQLAPIFMELVSAVMPMVVTILGAVLGALGPLISTIAGLLIPIIQALMPIVVTVFSVVADVITNVMQIIMGVIQVVTGIISGNWAQVFEGLLNIVSGVFGFILSVISGALQIVISVVGNGLNAVFGFFSSIFSGVVAYVSNSWASIINGASGMVGNLVNFFGGLGGKIMGALGDIGSTLFNTGKNIIQGLIDGISSMMGAIGRAVLNIVPEAIRGPFEQLLGIASPSKVFRGYGHNIGEGLVLGLEDMYDPIAEATAALAWVPDTPAFASSAAQSAYSAAAVAGDTGQAGVIIHSEVHPSEKMSEENLAEITARKIAGALT